MRMNVFTMAGLVVVLQLVASISSAADWGLKKGTPDLKSAGPLAFGPDGILLVGDTKSAAIFAIETGDVSGEPAKANINIDGLEAKIANAMGASASDVSINDLAVNSISGNVYLSLSIAGKPSLARVDGVGKISAVSLENVGFGKVQLPDAPEDKVSGEGRRARNRRDESITDLAFVDGKVLVSGLTKSEAPSSVREVPFPFTAADPGTSVEIYHGAHGRVEDYAAVRAFVPFNIGGEPNLLMGFTCTPLVKLPLKSLSPGEKVRGTTVAELGNRNRPLDMIVYEKGGTSWLLMANSARGVMKISTQDIDTNQGITERVGGGGTAGQTYETIKELDGTVQLDRLSKDNAIVLVQQDNSYNLRTVPLP